MTTPQPWRFLEPYWDICDILGWLIDHDPKLFGRFADRDDLGAETRYKSPTRKRENPARTLLRALQEGRLSAFRYGQELSPERWSAKYQISVGNDGDTRLRRLDVLALWPESWKWAQAVVWAVWRDEELAALCDQDRPRYAERGA
jgi:hypothetical protein